MIPLAYKIGIVSNAEVSVPQHHTEKGNIVINVGDVISYNFNFLIYIHNAYTNLENEGNKFPYLPLEREGFIDRKYFLEKGKEIWRECLRSDIQEEDIQYWLAEKFDFRVLFSQNDYGERNYRLLRKTFNSWFGEIGYRSLELQGEVWVPYVYEQLAENSKKYDCDIFLEIIFDEGPKEWKIYSDQHYFITIHDHPMNGSHILLDKFKND